MTAASGFTWALRSSGEIVIRHEARQAGILRGPAVARFLAVAEQGDEQAVQNALARLTGNYKRGNERNAKGQMRNA
ncbi:hypothetical protein HKCCE3408_09955 [Rhodobacterales bacterium HKCCE3408]|nr:hypothetical protein [Rhodobacterales bacterium HKCCE3408]